MVYRDSMAFKALMVSRLISTLCRALTACKVLMVLTDSKAPRLTSKVSQASVASVALMAFRDSTASTPDSMVSRDSMASKALMVSKVLMAYVRTWAVSKV